MQKSLAGAITKDMTRAEIGDLFIQMTYDRHYQQVLQAGIITGARQIRAEAIRLTADEWEDVSIHAVYRAIKKMKVGLEKRLV